ncbi:MAG: DUF4199 domain-containing protein [Bacteroidales bacterium]|nr:DUF4199 domain-containing protein [Bacteroidales bacterium]
MNFGALNGLAIMMVSLLIYIVGIQQNILISLIIYGLNIFFIVYGTKYLRDHYQNGQITYGKALGSGVLISLFMSILVAFFIFMFFKFLAPDELEKIYTQAEENMYNQGFSEEQIETAMQMTRKFTTPLTMALGTIFSYTFLGFIFSLITSSFIKKNAESYEQIMSEVEKEIKSENDNQNE